MNVLVLGKNSQIGKELSLFENDKKNNFFFTGSDEINILDKKIIESYINKIKPDLIVNLAAFTDVDGAEDDLEKAFLTNSNAPEYISFLANKYSIYFISISTDYVFNSDLGGPFDIRDNTNPINIYGKSKLDGELKILKNNSKSLIIRTSSVFSIHNRNFVKTIFNKLINHEDIDVVNDQKISMTFAGDLAQMIFLLINNNNLEKLFNEEKNRIIHFTNNGYTSWFNVANLIKDHIKSNSVINPIPTLSWKSKALRPIDSRLKLNYGLLNLLGIKSFYWEDRVIRVIDELRG